MNRKAKHGFWFRHKHIKHFVLVLLVLGLILIVWVVVVQTRNALFQARLQPFYNTQGITLTNNFGEVIKQEPLGVDVAGGNGYRILYRTQKSDGSSTISSAMVFVPTQPSSTPRPVLAWAHGTVGMGDACAPSRTEDPINYISWVGTAMQNGWVVTATDYAGLGTEGTEGYLVGNNEAHDVINSVRAARNMSDSQAGANFAVWGHSQGGHSALFTGNLASSYAPELNLVGTVASAPAAELIPLLNQQYNTSVAWVIGPEAMVSWPATYPNLNRDEILTSVGQRTYEKLAYQCITESAIEGLARTHLNQQFFSQNLAEVPPWRAVAQAQTAPTLPPTQPVMVAESLTDQVVLPNTTALYIQKSCNAGSNLTQLWVNNVGHIQIPKVISPQVLSWVSDRFASKPLVSNCTDQLPVPPATQ